MNVIKQVRVKGEFNDYPTYKGDAPKDWHSFADGSIVDVVEVYENGSVEAIGLLMYTTCADVRGPQTLCVGQFEEM